MNADGTETSDLEWRFARDEAHALLRDALGWQLLERRWVQARVVVEEMAVAVAAENADALRDATEVLELYAPVRVATRLGDSPLEPVPQALREQVSELLDVLMRADRQADEGKHDAPHP